MFDSFLKGNKSKVGDPILIMGMIFGKDWKKAFYKSSNQCIPLSLTHSVLISTLVLHFFGLWGGQILLITTKLFSILFLENSLPGPQGMRFLTHPLMFTHILNSPFFVKDFFLNTCVQLLQYCCHFTIP